MIWGAIILSRIRLEKVTNQGMVRSQGCPVRCWRGNALDLVTRRLQEFHGQVVQVYVSWVVLYVLVAKILNIWKSEFISIGHSTPDPSQVGLWQLGYWKAGRHGWDWGTAMARVFFWGLGTHWKAAKFQMLPDGSVKSKLLMAFEEIFGDFHWYKTTVYICLPRPRDRDLLPSTCRTQGPSIMLNAHPSLPMRLPGKTPVVLAHGSNDEVWPALLGPWSDDQHQKPHRCSLTKHITSKTHKKYMYMIWIYIYLRIIYSK